MSLMTGEIGALLRGGHRFLVAGHRSPDGDAFGSALGLARGLRALGKTVDVYCPDPIPSHLAFLVEGEEILRELPGAGRWDAAVVTDVAAPSLMPAAFPSEEIRGPLIVLDHHASHEDFGDHVIRDIAACSTGEVVWGLLRDLGLTGPSAVPPAAARALYAAVVSDTGGFRFSSTTAATLRLGAELVEAGAEPWPTARGLFEEWPRPRLELLREVLCRIDFAFDGRLAIIEIDRELLGRTGATDDMIDGLVGYGRRVAGVEVAALLWEQDPPSETGRVRLSLRASGDCDVAKIAGALGGGGHRSAAGATLSCSLAAARARVEATVGESLGGTVRGA
ncbi:MAG: bifunctional oligoribonuclease/PAP phosphatase NrnA [Deltaproteobacteria bacterium]|nr:MAG: bifunctional oligoribonuclease/PAP phosphatase NrnA [Deltaproteobacteria bacterium]